MLVQNTESPSVVISVPGARRSNRRISTLATASRTTVATKRKARRARRCSCVGVAPRATFRASLPPSRMGCGTPKVLRAGRSDVAYAADLAVQVNDGMGT